MRKTASATAAVLAALISGCGQSQDEGAVRPAPAPSLDDAQRAALIAALPAPYNAGDWTEGRRVFARCRACHTLNDGGANMTGPNLWQVFGREAGTHERYNYSPALRDAGFVWDAERLDQWLNDPRGFLPGNKMSFAGVRDETDRRNLIAFLKVETGFPPEAEPASPEAAP